MIEIIASLIVANNNDSGECFLRSKRCEGYRIIRVNKPKPEKGVNGLNVFPVLGKKNLPPVLETFTPKTSNK